MASTAGKYCANRLFEWVATVGLVNTGLILMFWPSTLASGNVRPLLHIVSSGELSAICLCAGGVRAVTLVLNGRLGKRGPPIRAVMALVGFFIWADMAAALWLRLGEPSIVTGILLAVMAGELRSIGRARRDLHHGG